MISTVIKTICAWKINELHEDAQRINPLVADFKTHISVAAVASGLLASTCLGTELIDREEMLLLWLAGTVGGILPDVDADNSTAIKTIFTLFALFFAFVLTFIQAEAYAVTEIWLTWGTVYVMVRYPVMAVFKDFTIHRGIYHSVLAGLFFWFAATAVCHRFFHCPALLAWLTGCFVFIGYMVHLLLDELYGVDFSQRRLKRSLGSAFKLVDYKKPGSAVLMVLATVIVFFLTPDPKAFTQVVTDKTTYQRMRANLLPATPQWMKNLRTALESLEANS